MIQTCTYLYSS